MLNFTQIRQEMTKRQSELRKRNLITMLWHYLHCLNGNFKLFWGLTILLILIIMSGCFDFLLKVFKVRNLTWHQTFVHLSVDLLHTRVVAIIWIDISQAEPDMGCWKKPESFISWFMNQWWNFWKTIGCF